MKLWQSFLGRSFLAVACLALWAPAAMAQPLADDATPEQILSALNLTAATPKQSTLYTLCFQKNERLGRLTSKKMYNVFKGLELIGVDVGQALTSPVCGPDGDLPFAYAFMFEDPRVANILVPTLADYAKGENKGDAWLSRILFFKYSSNKAFYPEQSIYDQYEEARVKELKRIDTSELAYRRELRALSPHYKRLFGVSGRVLDYDYLASYYGIQDVKVFVAYCNRYRNPEFRASIFDRATRAARGEYTPRGMVEGLEIDSARQCMTVPNLEQKLSLTESVFASYRSLEAHKEEALKGVAILKELKTSYKQLCPAGLALVANHPYCKTDYAPIVSWAVRATDNSVSGYTLAEFDNVQ